jgi:hypothetical protein
LLLLLLLLLTLLPQVLKCATNDDVCTLKVRPHPLNLHPIPSPTISAIATTTIISGSGSSMIATPQLNATQYQLSVSFNRNAGY